MRNDDISAGRILGYLEITFCGSVAAAVPGPWNWKSNGHRRALRVALHHGHRLPSHGSNPFLLFACRDGLQAVAGL